MPPVPWAYSVFRGGLWGSHGASRALSTAADAFGAPPQALSRRVVVTGLGLVTPLGVGAAAVWERLVAGATGVRALREEDLPEAHRAVMPQLPSQVVACVPREELEDAPWYQPEDPRRTAPFMQYALCAAAEALRDAGWVPATPAQRQATGVAIGAGMSCTADLADAGVLVGGGRLRRLSPFFIPRVLVNMAAGAVSIAHGLQGPNHAAATACATGAHGIGDAARLIRAGDADVMLAGGTEACVDAVALGGFSRLKALSTRYNGAPGAASRPFDTGRDGFVLGEGAGVVVLEELGHAAARGARVYAEVRGYGLSGDAHHITQPSEEGTGAALAMGRALRHAGLAPGQVCYVNAHATSTPIGERRQWGRAGSAAWAPAGGAARQGRGAPPPHALSSPAWRRRWARSSPTHASAPCLAPPAGAGDDVEQRAIAAVFGEAATAAARPGARPPLAVSSTKGATGHLLGAAGAVEAIFSILALHHGLAPVTLNLEAPDPPLLAGLVAGGPARLPPGPRAVLTNSFGFGGTNASLVFATPPGGGAGAA
eukprot:scaffold3.g6495.t1